MKKIYSSSLIPQAPNVDSPDSAVLMGIVADTHTGYAIQVKLETRTGTTVAHLVIRPGEALAIARSMRRAAKLTMRGWERACVRWPDARDEPDEPDAA